MPAGKTQTRRSGAIRLVRTCTILKPASELYAVWRRVEGNPSFMDHVESVEVVSPTESHWVARVAKQRLECADKKDNCIKVVLNPL